MAAARGLAAGDCARAAVGDVGGLALVVARGRIFGVAALAALDGADRRRAGVDAVFVEVWVGYQAAETTSEA